MSQPPCDSAMRCDYQNLETAGAILRLSPDEIIHLGAFGELFICANIYAMATGIRRIRVDLADECAQEYFALRSSQLLPPGIYEIGQDTLRALELPHRDAIEFDSGYKFDEYGWWEVYLDPPVSIKKTED